jgi:hypothetical protein
MQCGRQGDGERGGECPNLNGFAHVMLRASQEGRNNEERPVKIHSDLETQRYAQIASEIAVHMIRLVRIGQLEIEKIDCRLGKKRTGVPG